MFRVRKGIRYRRRKKIAVGIVLVTILLILLGGLIFRIKENDSGSDFKSEKCVNSSR